MNHSVVIRDFKGDDALDEFSYFIMLYIPSHPRFFNRNAAEISTHIFLSLLLSYLFYLKCNIRISFCHMRFLVLYKRLEIQGCYN